MVDSKDRICDALRARGLINPETEEAKRFCTTKCPYDKCVVAEIGVRTFHWLNLKEKARKLHAQGLSNPEIAQVLGKSERTIGRYLQHV